MSVSTKAIWYIESHLDQELSLDTVAEAIGISRFHLSRAFSGATGTFLAGYIRARRLGEAAKSLAGGAPHKPRLVQGEELLIFGLSQHHGQTNAAIPQQWNRFLPYSGRN